MISLYSDSEENIYEVELGAEGKFNNKNNVWGSIAGQLGDNDYNCIKGSFGFKVNF